MSKIIDIVKLYESGKSAADIARLIGRHKTSVLSFLKRRDIKIRNNQSLLQRKYLYNENFLDSIDNEEKAYFLGFFFADGNNRTKNNCVRIELAEQDKEILIKFKKMFNSSVPLKKRISRNEKWQNKYTFQLTNKHLSNRLLELGCNSHKTFGLKFPNYFDGDLTRHFVRGYFDGDGSITIIKNKKKSNNRAQICFVSTKEFLDGLRMKVKTTLNIDMTYHQRHPERTNNIFQSYISDINGCVKFLHWIYSDSSIFLNRKYEKYKMFSPYPS